MRTLYGFDAEGKDDSVLKLVWDCIEGSRQLLVAGGFLVDFFPILRFAPSFVPFQRKLAGWRTVNLQFKEDMFAKYKADIVSEPALIQFGTFLDKLRCRGHMSTTHTPA